MWTFQSAFADIILKFSFERHFNDDCTSRSRGPPGARASPPRPPDLEDQLYNLEAQCTI